MEAAASGRCGGLFRRRPWRGTGRADEVFLAALARLDEDRRLLMGFLESERREWPGGRDGEPR